MGGRAVRRMRSLALHVPMPRMGGMAVRRMRTLGRVTTRMLRSLVMRRMRVLGLTPPPPVASPLRRGSPVLVGGPVGATPAATAASAGRHPERNQEKGG
jgi:hypothetical protein